MQVIINIGLDTESHGAINPEAALNAVYRLGAIMRHSIKTVTHSKGEERTLIAMVNTTDERYSAVKSIIHGIADELYQDCIAIFVVSYNKGDLIGSKVGEWGEFNPMYFHFS